MSAQPPPADLSPLKRALLKIEELQEKVRTAELAAHEPLAIVGMACRFPGGADTLEKYWGLLRDGVSATTDVPADRWDVAAYFDPQPGRPGKMYTRRGGFVDDVDLFDAQFFGIAPREAAALDPQQRLLLEVAWEALEDAGQAPDRLAGSRTGVFVGLCTSDYATLSLKTGDPSVLDTYYASGTAHSIASGRLSYVFGFQGPSVAVDTACSSSLVALHLGCGSLRARECDMAVIGGANLMLSPENSVALCQASMLSADGRCKTFDADGDGYGRSEGCGVVVLKRLSDAVAHGDRIVALVRGTAINQDGPSSGLTAPHGPSQEAVIRAALANARIAPAAVGYVEAHGTGTSLGDPIEVQALGAVFRESHSAARPILVGSVKTNIGHAEAAAGIAGVLKVALGLAHRQIPPHLHFETPNRHIPWASLPIAVPTSLMEWPAQAGTRVAGVSSFGFSGTNAHVVLEEAPARAAEARTPDRPVHVLCLSARSDRAVREMARRYAARLDSASADTLADLCFTANAGRAEKDHRIAFVASDVETLRGSLLACSDGRGPSPQRRESPDAPKVAFLFTGQGSQYPGMGRGLYDTHAPFRLAIDRCDALLSPALPRSLRSVMFAQAGSPEAALLSQTVFTQPALFAVEYALAELWMSLGVHPAAVLGHSVGEYVAAVISGMMSLEDGLRLIAARGRLMQSLPAGGAMAAVFTTEAAASAAIEPYRERVAIAAVNGPDNVVISGDSADIGEIVAAFARQGVQSKPLAVSHAFHSPLVDPVLDTFTADAARMAYAAPQIAVVSNVTGAMATGAAMRTPEYWRRHMREPVRFADGVRALAGAGCEIFLEVGPSATLLGMAARCLPDGTAAWLPSLRAGRDDWRTMLESVANLFMRGGHLDWETFDATSKRRRVALPTYPFERTRHWLRLPARGRHHDTATAGAGRHPLIGVNVQSPLAHGVYELRVSTSEVSFLADHVVHGMTVFPTVAYLEMACAVARGPLGMRAPVVEDLTIHALAIPVDGARTTQLVIDADSSGSGYRFRLHALSDDAATPTWTIHAAGRLEERADTAAADEGATLETIRERCAEAVDVDRFYAGMRARGLQFGEGFRTVRRLHRRDGEAVAEIELSTPGYDDAASYAIHPVVVDGAIQIVGAAVPGFVADDEAAPIYMPIGLDRFELSGARKVTRLISRAWIESGAADGETLTAHVALYTTDGEQIGAFHGLRLKYADDAALQRAVAGEAVPWAYQVEWVPAAADGSALAPVPPATAISAHLATRLPRLCEESGVDLYDRLNPGLDRLSTAHIVSTFRRLGWPLVAGTTTTAAHLIRDLRIVDRHARLAGRLLAILEEDGIIETFHGQYRVVSADRVADPAMLAGQLLAEFDTQRDELELLDRCGSSLAAALVGDADPLQLLFPGGDTERTARIYKRSPLAVAFNGAVREAVAKITAELPDGRTLRILEVGGGTGGTTTHVLDRLSSDRVEYTFTDIGALFVANAARAFSAFPFVRYELLDIEKDPEAQGFQAGAYDVVLASNVIHATQRVDAALAHVRRLLAPGGVLILLEGTRPQRWLDLSFGLTDGWWRFVDVERRNYPLMSRPAWLDALAGAGFDQAAAIPAADSGGAAAQNAVILARAAAGPSAQVEGTWLVFAAAGERLGEDLAASLTACGARPMLVRPGSGWSADGDGYTIDPASADEFRHVVEQAVCHAGAELRGAVYLWSAVAPRLDPDTASLWQAQDLGCRGALHLVQALTARPDAGPAIRLCLVTRGAQAVLGEGRDRDTAVAHAPIWGLGKGIALEHPELRCVRVDLDPQGSDGDAAHLMRELFQGDSADEVAYRAGERRVARLIPASSRIASSRGASPRVTPRLLIGAPGDLTSLRLVHGLRRRPGAGEVELAVHAAGLNFRDVLNAIGMRHDPEPLGGECAGVVTAVGPDVVRFKPGDRVMGLARGSFAPTVTTRADYLASMPPGWDFEQAATAPIAFLTAQYALHTVGRLQRGERILIHAAAGGVGLAAVRLARLAGAEVYATAGSDAKREYLRSIGVEHVMDSRSLAFADQVLHGTRGTGIDLVLNALTGESLRRSLALLTAGGRFLEIGHSEAWDEAAAAAVNPHARYFSIDLAERIPSEPALVNRIFKELLPLFEAGDLTPLPHTAFPLEAASEAFEYMARARHIGKVVLVPSAPQERAVLSDAAPTTRPDGTYLITGGLSGLGLLAAEWLAMRGARHLALLARRAAATHAQQVIARLRKAGVSVMTWQADVSDEVRMAVVLREIDERMPPLRGVMHAAGVLDDGVLTQQRWDRFVGVMRPKVAGAWILHRLTRPASLDWFVLFSSMSGVLGSAGQSNHSAANAFLDVLAHHRRALGLPALSIDWGVWSEVGAAADRGADKRVVAQGVGVIAPAEGLQMLEQVLGSGATQMVVAPLNLEQLVREFPGAGTRPFFSALRRETRRSSPAPAITSLRRESGAGAGRSDVTTLAEQLATVPASRQRMVLTSHVQSIAARVLGLEPGEIDRRLPLSEMGLDSLMAVELRNALGSALGRTLPATLLFDYPTVEVLTAYLGSKVLELEGLASVPPVVTGSMPIHGSADDLLSAIEGMSDGDVDGLLQVRS